MPFKRRIFVNSISGIIQVVVSSIVLIIVYGLFIRTAGTELLGIWSFLNAFMAVARLGELGFGAAVTKFVAQYTARGDSRRALLAFTTGTVSVTVFVGFTAGSLYLLIQPIMVKMLPNNLSSIALPIIPYILLATWLSALSGVIYGAIDGLQRLYMRCLVVIISQVAFLICALLLVPHEGLLGLVYAQLIQCICGFLIAIILIYYLFKPLTNKLRLWDRHQFLELVTYGGQFQIINIMMLLWGPTTRMFLANFGNYATIGYYEMASQLVEKMRMLITAANQAVIPYVADIIEENYEQIARVYSINIAIMIYLALPLFTAIVAMAPTVSLLWIGNVEPIFVFCIIILSVGWFVSTLCAPAYFMYLGIGRLRWVTIGHIGIGFTNITLGAIFVATHDWNGIVASAALSLVIGSLIFLIAYHRENHINYKEFVSPNNKFLFLTSITGAVLGLYIPSLLRGATPQLLITTPLVFFLIIALPMWNHPIRVLIGNILFEVWNNRLKA